MCDLCFSSNVVLVWWRQKGAFNNIQHTFSVRRKYAHIFYNASLVVAKTVLSLSLSLCQHHTTLTSLITNLIHTRQTKSRCCWSWGQAESLSHIRSVFRSIINGEKRAYNLSGSAHASHNSISYICMLCCEHVLFASATDME